MKAFSKLNSFCWLHKQLF